jgi:hypothetical protein
VTLTFKLSVDEFLQFLPKNSLREYFSCQVKGDWLFLPKAPDMQSTAYSGLWAKIASFRIYQVRRKTSSKRFGCEATFRRSRRVWAGI